MKGEKKMGQYYKVVNLIDQKPGIHREKSLQVQINHLVQKVKKSQEEPLE